MGYPSSRRCRETWGYLSTTLPSDHLTLRSRTLPPSLAGIFLALRASSSCSDPSSDDRGRVRHVLRGGRREFGTAPAVRALARSRASSSRIEAATASSKD